MKKVKSRAALIKSLWRFILEFVRYQSYVTFFFQFIKTQDKLLFRYLFHADIPFLYPPENIRNPKFSDVSGGIEMEYRRELG